MKIRRLAVCGALLGFLLPFQNCGAPGSGGAGHSSFTGTSTYADIQSQIISQKCTGCHMAGTLDFRTYASLMASGTIVAGQPANSLLYQKVSSGEMPRGGPRLGAAELKAINDWIAAGAPNN